MSATPVDEKRLAAAAAEVYASAPEDFMATRARLVADAKTVKDPATAKEIGRLRKPSVSAWALNLLVHHRDPVIAELADLGARMRSATSRLDMGELAELRPARDSALADLVRAAVGVVAEGGRTLSPAGQDEVRGTGIAALADASAQRALETGTLTRALAYSGFGEVDIADAVAVTSTGRVLAVVRGGREDAVAEPDEDADDPGQARVALESACADADSAMARAQTVLESARDDAAGATERREAAERQLERAEEAERAASERLAAAKRALRDAERAAREARAALDAT